MTSDRHLILNYVIRAQGSATAAWRHPSSRIEDVTDLGFYLAQAKLAESGKFDAVFLTDTLAQSATVDDALQWPLDPIVLLSAVAALTSDIGVIATHSTTFNDPYNTARAFASLDHVSGGRAGWNVVTSTLGAAARNFGREDVPEHDARYRRAAEYLAVVTQLWNAWLPGAVIGDAATGDLVDTDLIQAINYESSQFRVRGPLNTPTSPQVAPVIAQAGGSPAGRAFAAAYADIVYAQHNGHDDARTYREDLRARAVKAGRSADAVKLLPGLVPFVGASRAEAEKFRRELVELHDPTDTLVRLGEKIGADLSELDLSAKAPEHLLNAIAASDLGSSVDFSGNPTWREIGYRFDSRYTHKIVAGTPEDVADYIEVGYTSGAFDGVSIVPPVIPLGLEEFVDRVVPILQRRGVHKKEYSGGTLRERLGSTPPSFDTTNWQGHYA